MHGEVHNMYIMIKFTQTTKDIGKYTHVFEGNVP